MTEPVEFRFDERVNMFVGPNASGKSTVLLILANLLNGPGKNSKRPISEGFDARRLVFISDDEFDKLVRDVPSYQRFPNYLSASQDWAGTREEYHEPEVEPAVVYIGSVREGLPGISGIEDPYNFGYTFEEIVDGPFSGSRAMCAYEMLGKELWGEERKDFPEFAQVTVMDAVELGDACSKYICDEIIRDSASHNYIPGPDVRGYLNHPLADPNKIPVHRLMGINTNDIRNFDNLPSNEEPSYSAYQEDANSVPIYLGHLSSGTEGTLLWIRWLVLKMVHHYGFERGWQEKPAILLIDEIENHLHPTWQRRVIPALLEHFPGLQIFATTHSPFVVAGLKAGQVHLLSRDEDGVVTATTNPQDVIGWTADEILRTMMGVPDPTDDATAMAAEELRRLRNGGPAATEVEEQERQERILELRRKVDRDLLAGGPMAARRELFEEQFAAALEKYRQSSQGLNQENG